MKFTEVRINNFYNLENVHLDLTIGNTLIVGPNGSGKTNIIKCIHHLVNQILSQEQTILITQQPRRKLVLQNRELSEPLYVTESKIRNLNVSSLMEIDAKFNKVEVELFSELRVLFLMADVIDLVYYLTQYFVAKIYNQAREKFRGNYDSVSAEGIAQLGRNLQLGLPERTLNVMSNLSLLSDRDSNYCTLRHNLNNSSRIAFNSPCVTSLVVEVTNKLFPKLLEITGLALSDCKEKPRRKGPDVVLKACAQKNVHDLKYSIDVKEDAWLPVTSYAEEEQTEICNTLCEVFGHMEGVQFIIRHSPDLHLPSSAYAPLNEAIQGLFGTSHENLKVIVTSGDAPKEQLAYCDWREGYTGWVVGDERLLDMLQSTDWGIIYSKCMTKLNQGGQDSIAPMNKRTFLQFSAKVCLQKSTVNCILPQMRNVALEHDEHYVTLHSVEQLLIKSKLSEDVLIQQQFKKVKDGMKLFCGGKIQVLQKKEGAVPSNEKEAKKVKRVLKKLDAKDRAALYELGHNLSDIAHEMMRNAPSWCGDLHVVLTRTLHNEESSYTQRMLLSELSGGEMEVLMVLCAIHLSGGDTVFLDEPGHSLHPSQQAQLRCWIETLQYPDPVCVVITHSAELINHNSLRSLYHMASTGRGFTAFKLKVEFTGEEQPQAIPMEVCPSSETLTQPNVTLSKEIIGELMRPDMRKMFFASGVYFVEGESDKLVLSAMRHHMSKKARDKQDSKGLLSKPQTMEALKLDRWDILALGGCGNAMKAYKASAELKIPCALVLDADTITVKTGTRVEPLSSDTWKKSMLYRALTNQRNSLEVAGTVLNEIENMFSTGFTQGQTPQDESRKILQKHGIWVWKGDLESEVCDSPAKREKLKEMDDLMEALGESFARSCSVRGNPDRGTISVEDALTNYNRNVLVPLESLMDELHCELDSARDRICEDPSQRVTNELQSLIDRIKNCKQRLNQHDNFCEKGSKRTAGRTDSGATPSKKFASEPLASQAQSQASPQEEIPAAVNLDKISWDRLKRKLHGGGWTKLPWETLLKVMEVCLDAEGSHFQELYEFMKKCQYKAIN